MPLTAASRVLAGEVPYKDFWLLYPPGIVYLVVVLSGLTKDLVLALRLIDLITKILICFLIFKICHQINRNRFFLIFVLITSILVLLNFHIQGYNVLEALVLALLSSSLFEKSYFKSFLSGVSFAAVAVFRLDFFVYLLLTNVILIVFERLFNKEFKAKHYYFFLLGACPLFLFYLIILVSNFEIALDFYSQCFIAPLKLIPRYCNIPYPKFKPGMELIDVLSVLRFYLTPLFLLSVLIYVFIIRYFKHENINTNFMTIPLFGVFLLNQVRYTSDFIHLAPSFLMLFITLIIVITINLKKLDNKKLKIVERFCKYSSLSLLLIAYAFMLYPSIEEIKICRLKQLTFASCLLRNQGDRLKAIEKVKEIATNQKQILLVSNDNDNVYTNDVAFFALVQKLPLTKYHVLHAGVVTTPKTQEEIISAVENSYTRIIIEQINTAGTKTIFNSNPESVNPDYNLLDNYIKDNFHLIYTIGSYNILEKNV